MKATGPCVVVEGNVWPTALGREEAFVKRRSKTCRHPPGCWFWCSLLLKPRRSSKRPSLKRDATADLKLNDGFFPPFPNALVQGLDIAAGKAGAGCRPAGSFPDKPGPDSSPGKGWGRRHSVVLLPGMLPPGCRIPRYPRDAFTHADVIKNIV